MAPEILFSENINYYNAGISLIGLFYNNKLKTTIISLIGQARSGKSTLANIIASYI